MLFSNRDLKKLMIPLVIEQLLAVTVGFAKIVFTMICFLFIYLTFGERMFHPISSEYEADNGNKNQTGWIIPR